MGKPWLLYKLITTGKSRKGRGDRTSSGGCMSAIFNRHQPSLISETAFNNIHQEQPSNNIPKGVEAPRNSLELKEHKLVVEEAASSSPKINQETNFYIPMGRIQIKTKRSRIMEDASSESCNSSPGTKTPNLVARLMGLDLLPENSSPRLSSYNKNNACSLPATPRISVAARPSTETDHHHRLSLQIIDESSRQYAKQIAKQVRENINRRVGADITNVVNKREQRRDEFLEVVKAKRPAPLMSTATATGKSRNVDHGHGCGKENEPIPPRLRFLKIENNLNKPNSNSPLLSSCSEVIKAPSSTTTKSSLPIKVHKCTRIASEKYDLRLKKMPRQEAPFLRKRNKSIPLSNVLSVNTSTLFPQKQVPLSSVTLLPSRQSRSYNNYGVPSASESDTRVVGGVVLEEEAEEVVTEIESDLVETLVNEVAGIIWHVG
ncbi:uncharacterized protein LOC143532781 [Bidens hawaiensis]|uniref:uncharacterized protein LOC143532781 n=1 Tax=Bidens hawaiensis TaxID=980011 RepID=UPI00404A56D2